MIDLEEVLVRRTAGFGTSLAPRARLYLAAGTLPLVAAVAARDAPLAALGLPFLLVLLAALVLDTRAAEATITAELSAEEEVGDVGQRFEVVLSLRSSVTVSRCRVELMRTFEGLEPGRPTKTEVERQLAAVDLDRPARWLCRLAAGRPTELSFGARLNRPGEVVLGPVQLLVSGPLGIYRRSLELPGRLRLRARAAEENLRALPRASRVRVAVGDRLARRTGDGIELAEVRPERPGDRTLPINWRATARRGVTHVTLRHPEQSTDVVVFADTFDPGLLPRVVEAAASCASAYLARRDRVGLVCFGGVLDWVEAGAGTRQLERIRLRLAATSPFFSYAWKTIDRIPPRALPAGAIVLVISPLRDERAVAAVAELRARGHDVVVVEVTGPPSAGGDVLAEAARLLDTMEREDLRRRLFTLGIAVAPLGPGQPLEAVVGRLSEVTRRLRPVARR